MDRGDDSVPPVARTPVSTTTEPSAIAPRRTYSNACLAGLLGAVAGHGVSYIGELSPGSDEGATRIQTPSPMIASGYIEGDLLGKHLLTEDEDGGHGHSDDAHNAQRHQDHHQPEGSSPHSTARTQIPSGRSHDSVDGSSA